MLCISVCVEPQLSSLSGETLVPKSEDTSVEARLDITLLSLIVGLPLINRGGGGSPPDIGNVGWW